MTNRPGMIQREDRNFSICAHGRFPLPKKRSAPAPLRIVLVSILHPRPSRLRLMGLGYELCQALRDTLACSQPGHAMAQIHRKQRARIFLLVLATLAAGGAVGAGVGLNLYPLETAVAAAAAIGAGAGVYVFRAVRRAREERTLSHESPSSQCPTCKVPLTLLADPPSAQGFEFSLYGCPRCQYRIMKCFCVASSTSGTEAVTPEDAAFIMNTDPLELKPFMKAWQERVIGA